MAAKSRLNYIDFLKKVKSGVIDKVYYIAAQDNYFVSRAVSDLKDNLFGSGNSNNNYFVRYGDENKYNEIIDLCHNFSSFFAEKKLVVVKRCEKFGKSLSHILAYEEMPDESTTLVLVFDADYVAEKKLDKDKKFYDFAEIPREYYFQWIKEEFKKRGCIIDNEETQYFASIVPLMLDIAEKEIEKISSYLASSSDKKVTNDVILLMTGFDKTYSPGELMNSVLSRNKKRTFDILDYLIDKASINEIYLLSIITQYFTDLLCFKTKGFASRTPNELYKYKIWGDKANFARENYSKYSEEQLSKIFEMLLETDKKFKTTQLDTKALLFSLAEQIINV
jgi:DNA polymerase III delta subunit